ncbi:hypothetical protein KM043_015565 [Ampulex compressa]|nr:hypothetical protein KM043_015565 [Ampulex compressa]
MKLRDTNEPRQRTDGANGTRNEADGRTDGQSDGPTLRTNWSHEILGGPKADDETEERRWTRCSLRRKSGRGAEVLERVVRWVCADRRADARING